MTAGKSQKFKAVIKQRLAPKEWSKMEVAVIEEIPARRLASGGNMATPPTKFSRTCLVVRTTS